MKKFVALIVPFALACGGAPTQQEPAPAPTKTPSSAPQAVDESFRAVPPQGGAAPALVAPVIKKSMQKNGLTVLTSEKSELPIVSVRVVLMAGSAQDPKTLPGVAGFVGDMLKSGTPTRDANTIADEIETLGAALEVSVDEDTTSVGFTSLVDNYEKILDVVADVVKNSNFKPNEIEKVRKRRLAALEQQKDDPSATASRVFARALFGDLPYGHTVLGTTEAVKKITRNDLIKFHASYGPKAAAVIVVGAAKETDVLAAVEKRFGAWESKVASVPAPPPAPVETTRKLVLVNKADAPQSQLRIGEISAARSDPEYFKLVLMNAVLGGLFNSRINMNLREDKGYTYGARSSFDFSRGRSPFMVGTGVRTDATGPSIAEVLKEIEKMRTSDVTADELAHAKNSYSLSLPSLFQTAGAVTSMIANLYVNELPLDYYQTLPRALAAVTVADVRAAAETRLHPSTMSVVVVGDAAKVEPALRELGLGAFETWTAEGDPAVTQK